VLELPIVTVARRSPSFQDSSCSGTGNLISFGYVAHRPRHQDTEERLQQPIDGEMPRISADVHDDATGEAGSLNSIATAMPAPIAQACCGRKALRTTPHTV